ncbi:hypothetical protein B0H15DRAFT_945971 [Mycena belliarum]|uniref:Uncharacterized protein n=1 Tax=Mycena belliarum TaxID=1033014 RepID=A0AAD6UFR4_9AGAR|nr:hypothetical protein B0H15DRAFT_945971 [Mycena belliae]
MERYVIDTCHVQQLLPTRAHRPLSRASTPVGDPAHKKRTYTERKREWLKGRSRPRGAPLPLPPVRGAQDWVLQPPMRSRTRERATRQASPHASPPSRCRARATPIPHDSVAANEPPLNRELRSLPAEPASMRSMAAPRPLHRQDTPRLRAQTLASPHRLCVPNTPPPPPPRALATLHSPRARHLVKRRSAQVHDSGAHPHSIPASRRSMQVHARRGAFPTKPPPLPDLKRRRKASRPSAASKHTTYRGRQVCTRSREVPARCAGMRRPRPDTPPPLASAPARHVPRTWRRPGGQGAVRCVCAAALATPPAVWLDTGAVRVVVHVPHEQNTRAFASPTKTLGSCPGQLAFSKFKLKFGTGTKTNKEKVKGVDAGFSTDTPSFLRRSKTARVTDDLRVNGSKNVQIVASSAALLFDTVQAGVLERVHQIVRALINLCGNANARVSGLAPMMARAVDGLIETLTKVHTFLQAQAPHGLFARILRCFEMQEQLNQCADVLQQALDVFGSCLPIPDSPVQTLVFRPPTFAPLFVPMRTLRTSSSLVSSLWPLSSHTPSSLPFIARHPDLSDVFDVSHTRPITSPPPAPRASPSNPVPLPLLHSLHSSVQTDLITNAALGSLRRAAATRHDEVLAALRAKWGLPAAGAGGGHEAASSVTTRRTLRVAPRPLPSALLSSSLDSGLLRHGVSTDSTPQLCSGHSASDVAPLASFPGTPPASVALATSALSRVSWRRDSIADRRLPRSASFGFCPFCFLPVAASDARLASSSAPFFEAGVARTTHSRPRPSSFRPRLLDLASAARVRYPLSMDHRGTLANDLVLVMLSRVMAPIPPPTSTIAEPYLDPPPINLASHRGRHLATTLDDVPPRPYIYSVPSLHAASLPLRGRWVLQHAHCVALFDLAAAARLALRTLAYTHIPFAPFDLRRRHSSRPIIRRVSDPLPDGRRVT